MPKTKPAESKTAASKTLAAKTPPASTIAPAVASPAPRIKLRPADLVKSVSSETEAGLSLFSADDLRRIAAGEHWQLYQRLGAHPSSIAGQRGTRFAVWAPNAAAVSVFGDFNQWNPQSAPLRSVQSSGIWEAFVPAAAAGDRYKYRIIDSCGQVHDKADPFAFRAESPPQTASIVAHLDGFNWQDQQWMAARREFDPAQRPISVYEVHLGSWRKKTSAHDSWLSYREITQPLIDYCLELGFTHLELLPISEHPYTPSWGYQTLGYFCPTSRYGSPHDLMYLIDACHQHGLGVIVDWVPAHFPKDAHGLARFDGTALYEHADPRQGEHPDWQTYVFNYGRNEVANYLISSALFWLDHYHVDGLRVDAVASMLYLDYSRRPGQWIPNRYGGRENLEAIEFLRTFNEQVHRQFPGVLTIAEESTAFQGVSHPIDQNGLGFDLKWNMGWMNDTLRYMRQDPIHRRYHHDSLTFSLVYAFSENFMLPLSHDEVVHGKGSLLDQMPGDLWQKFANLRLLYSYMWTHPGKKLLFMGGELGQWCEWNFDGQLDWPLLQQPSHAQLQTLVRDLNRLYQSLEPLYEMDFDPTGFQWIDCDNASDSTLAYVRYARDRRKHLVIACNFTPVVRHDRRFGVPGKGTYREVFNSDSRFYGGTDVGNLGSIRSCPQPSHGQPHSIEVTLPPLGVCVFQN